jgi:chlorobactene glucosyltransferase
VNPAIEALAALVAASYVVFVLRGIDVVRRSRDALEERALDVLPPLTIVVPARNEERQIERCVRSLLAQAYSDLRVIVVDDRSDDATASIVERLAREDGRLALLRGGELPGGWVGKPWALHQGVAGVETPFVLATDADTIHERGAARAAVSYAIVRNLDVLSLVTTQLTESLGERLVLPAILYAIFWGVGPLDDINDPCKPNAIFNGQYILFRREALASTGDYENVRAEIAEDLELARRFKRERRFRTRLVDSNGLVSTRMYRSFCEVWNGFVKNFALGVRDFGPLKYAALAFFALLSPIGPLTLVVLLASDRWLEALGVALLIALSVAVSEYALRRGRYRAWSGLALPIGMAVLTAIFATSLWQHGRSGVVWRGRRYAP